VVSGGNELDDDKRERVAKAMTSAACTNACRSDDGKRLETVQHWCASGGNDVLDLLHCWSIWCHQCVRLRTGRRLGTKGGGGVPHRHRNR
jgi:hypothetical protein